jgi:hypothetical protein
MRRARIVIEMLLYRYLLLGPAPEKTIIETTLSRIGMLKVVSAAIKYLRDNRCWQKGAYTDSSSWEWILISVCFLPRSRDSYECLSNRIGMQVACMSIVGFRFCQVLPASHSIEGSKSFIFCQGRDRDSYGGMHKYTCLTYPNLE